MTAPEVDRANFIGLGVVLLIAALVLLSIGGDGGRRALTVLAGLVCFAGAMTAFWHGRKR